MILCNTSHVLLVYTCFRRVSVNQTAKMARFSLCCACFGDSDCHRMSA